MPEVSGYQENILTLIESVGFFPMLKHLSAYARQKRDTARREGKHYQELGWGQISNTLIMLPMRIGNIDHK